jgi:hypothetical protein
LVDGWGRWMGVILHLHKSKKKIKKKNKKKIKKKKSFIYLDMSVFLLTFAILKILQNLHLCQLLLEAMKAWYWIGWEGYDPM